MRGASIAEASTEQPDDERLRQLLAIEKRLEDLVEAAAKHTAQRITAARAAREQRLAEAREAAERANAARSREELVAHEEMLAAIERHNRMALAAITGVSDERVDELARWALDQVIGTSGEPA